MEIVPVQEETTPRRAALALSHGEIVLYPTDTLYGLGADALSDDAVAKIYAIKGREEGKPIHAIVADLDMAERFAYVDDTARLLAEKFLPGPLTLILKKKPGIETGIARDIDTFGIRIPNHPFCRALVDQFGGPVTTTSANRSGMHPMRNLDAILAQLGEQGEGVALCVDAGELPQRLPSTVIDLSGGTPNILREGAISAEEIRAALDV